MGRKLNRNKSIPPPISVKFRDWDEWDLWEEHARAIAFGHKADLARDVLLRDARAAKAEAR